MAGKIITLPLRVSFQSARLLTRVTAGTAGRALALAGQTIGAVTPSPPTPRTTAPTPPPPRREAPSVRAVSSIRTPRPEPAPPLQAPEPVHEPKAPPLGAAPKAPPPGAAEKSPVHVSEEPELVREVAEPGAEDGAGATITVAEPWNGYGRLSAKDVVARARSADRAELAAVRLYEARHRSRQTVLAAVDRQLKLSNGGAPA
jgi:hypothetical protein